MRMASRILLVACIVLTGAPAMAQTQTRKFFPTGDLVKDIKNTNSGDTGNSGSIFAGKKIGDTNCTSTGDPTADLQCVIKAGGAKLILHLKQSYALAAAKDKNGTPADNTAATCNKALVPIVNLVVNGPQPGSIPADDPMALTSDEQTMASDPKEADGAIVVMEKTRILRLALQSPSLNDACGALVQDEVKNAQNLVGKVTSLLTGAGLTGVTGIPLVP